jgi:hypothetical protein
MRLFEFIASRIPYKIFSYILCQILSSFTNKISGVQMGRSLKYQVAIQLGCLVFLCELLGPHPGTDVPRTCMEPAPACIPQALVSFRDALSIPAAGFCVVLTRIVLHMLWGSTGRGDLGNGSCRNEGFLFEIGNVARNTYVGIGSLDPLLCRLWRSGN